LTLQQSHTAPTASPSRTVGVVHLYILGKIFGGMEGNA